MTIISDRELTISTLKNFRYWAADYPLDYAEIDFYASNPQFRAVIPWACRKSYSNTAALYVEDVLREMYRKGYRAERQILIWYYAERMSQYEIGKLLGISQRSVGRNRLPPAQDMFTIFWLDMIGRKHYV